MENTALWDLPLPPGPRSVTLHHTIKAPLKSGNATPLLKVSMASLLTQNKSQRMSLSQPTRLSEAWPPPPPLPGQSPPILLLVRSSHKQHRPLQATVPRTLLLPPLPQGLCSCSPLSGTSSPNILVASSEPPHFLQDRPRCLPVRGSDPTLFDLKALPQTHPALFRSLSPSLFFRDLISI